MTFPVPLPTGRRGRLQTRISLLVIILLMAGLLAGCATRSPERVAEQDDPTPHWASLDDPATWAAITPGNEGPAAAEDAAAAAETYEPEDSGVTADAEALYRQALGQLAGGELDHAEDLLHVLQDQLGDEVIPEGIPGHEHLRSLGRRVRLLAALLAEAEAMAGVDSASQDSLLAAGYERARGLGLPDSLLPLTGPARPPLVADLLRLDNGEVRKWIDYFTGPGRKQFDYWLRRQAAVDSLLTAQLAAAGLPRELVYLAMIESGLSPHARSAVGAVGVWQFMPGTARLFDLRRDWWVDERKDLEMATQAAIAYLSQLYDEFHDWALVLAAYNAGEGRIRRAIKVAGHDDFWRLALPAQTRDYVPKFIAAARLGEDPQRYGFAPVEPQPALAYDVVPIDDATDLALVARCAGVDEHEVFALNPGLLRRASPPDSPAYPVRVPYGTGERCQERLKKVPPEERLTWRRHRVVSGETLGGIARRYGTSVQEIAQLNKIRNAHLIRPGDQLLIPMPAVLAQKADARAAERAKTAARKGQYVPPPGYEKVTYKVQKGDTLYGIARKLKVSLAHLKKVNRLKDRSIIKPGQRILAYVPASG